MTKSNNSGKRLVFLISGPLGTGKSTVSKPLAKKLPNCVLIEGDHLFHMFNEGSAVESTPWERRVSVTWTNLAAVTRTFLQDGLNVVIDFVVEEELEWFKEQIADFHAEIHYAVLRADAEILKNRLERRGDPDSLNRSLFLLRQLEASPANQLYLYDTTTKQPEEIVLDLLEDDRFKLPRTRKVEENINGEHGEHTE